jgi:hypothetical protein
MRRNRSTDDLPRGDLIANSAVTAVSSMGAVLAVISFCSGNFEFGAVCIGLAGFIVSIYCFRRVIQWLNRRQDPHHSELPPDAP